MKWVPIKRWIWLKSKPIFQRKDLSMILIVLVPKFPWVIKREKFHQPKRPIHQEIRLWRSIHWSRRLMKRTKLKSNQLQFKEMMRMTQTKWIWSPMYKQILERRNKLVKIKMNKMTRSKKSLTTIFSIHCQQTKTKSMIHHKHCLKTWTMNLRIKIHWLNDDKAMYMTPAFPSHLAKEFKAVWAHIAEKLWD